MAPNSHPVSDVAAPPSGPKAKANLLVVSGADTPELKVLEGLPQVSAAPWYFWYALTAYRFFTLGCANM